MRFNTHQLYAVSLLILTVLLQGCVIASPNSIITEDDWRREQPYSYSISEMTPLNSPHIYRFEWRGQDDLGNRKTKGTELTTRAFRDLSQGKVYFEFYIPYRSFQEETKLTIISQFHSNPDYELGEKWRQPISNLLIRNGRLHYDYRSSIDRVTPIINNEFVFTSKGSIDLGPIVYDKWNRFELTQNFDFTLGSMYFKLNNSIKSIEKAAVKFNDANGTFFKFGLYLPEGSDLPDKIIYFRNIEVLMSNPKGVTRYTSSK